MTVGEKIQTYRKNLGISQEELGQKLLVSRQTVSLWEKDQTVPTIDNLIRLREIFGVSVDELLGFATEEQNNENKLLEEYTFNFPKEELKDLFRAQGKGVFIKPIIFTVACIYLFLFFLGNSAPDFVLGLCFGALVFGVLGSIRNISLYRKTRKESLNRISESTYEYKFFENFIEINIYRKNEKLHKFKYYYTDIKQINPLKKWFFLQLGNQLFIIRKSDLKENSVLYSYMYKNPQKTIKKDTQGKWKTASVILFIASILSMFFAMFLVGTAMVKNNLTTESMWLFFLFTPIPIASIIFGFVLKSKGYKYKKNIIVGIIITVLLCIYGSFSFIFSNMYDHSDEPIIKVEQTLGIDIPEYEQINTMDWTDGTQTVSRGYIYYTSDVYFEDFAVEEFEKQIKTNEKWLSAVPNDLVGITSPINNYDIYDFVLIYNMDTSAYNELPISNGKYRFINILYKLEDKEMKIIEYDIDYIK